MYLFNAPRQYPAVYQHYYEEFDFYNGRDKWLESIKGIPIQATHLFALHWLHLEVHNGGFWQYFYNSTCHSMPEAIAGYDAIGMSEVAETIRSASAELGDPFPFETEERRKLVGEPVGGSRMDFNEYENQFYELADTNRLIFRKKPKFVPFADAYAANYLNA